MAKEKSPITPTITEFAPEVNEKTPDQIKAEQHRQKIQMFLASANRERQRILDTNGVRLGDSVIHEAKAIELIDAALAELEAFY